MTATPFELFGERAHIENDFLEIAARLGFQKESEKFLLLDLVQQLSLTPQDTLLEIGCGPGNLLIPLSFFVKSAAGIDHENLLAKIPERIPRDKDAITLIPGNFLDVPISKKFSRVLIYSVLHYMRDEKELIAFVHKAADLVQHGGVLFIGDVPNADLKQRFLSSAKGKKFTVEWKKKEAEYRTSAPAQQVFQPTTPLVRIDDKLIGNIVKELRSQGIRASVRSQPKELAMSYTRIDIVGKKKK